MDSTPSIFVLITGYGKPQVDLKQQILKLNIDKIAQYPWSRADIHICIYDDTSMNIFHENLNIHIHREPGIVGDFSRRHITQENLKGYDYVLLLLDDILLMPDVEWCKIIEYKKEFLLDIVSPSLTLDSKHVYKYMLTDTNAQYTLKISPACEYFAYFMDPSSALRYVSHLESVNPWGWGMDLILYRHINLRVGILNKMTMKHFIERSCYDLHLDKLPTEGYNSVLKKYGENGDKELTMLPNAFYYIFESASPSSAKLKQPLVHESLNDVNTHLE